jgi:hypothetical protein
MRDVESIIYNLSQDLLFSLRGTPHPWMFVQPRLMPWPSQDCAAADNAIY